MTDLEKTIKSYNQTVEEYAEKTESLFPEEDAEAFLSHLEKDDLILDLGCGVGRDTVEFIKRGYKAFGVDLSEGMIAYAMANYQDEVFRIMDMRQLKFGEGRFDGVWASASFLHLSKEDARIAMEEVRRVLKPGGVFYIAVKRGEGEELKNDDRYGGVEKFWSYYRQEGILNILKDFGFSDFEVREEEQDNDYATNPWINIICKKI